MSEIRMSIIYAHVNSEIDLFSLQDNYTAGSDPTASTLTNYNGNVDFHLSYCPATAVSCGSSLGSGWVDPPGGYVTANNKAWKSISFPQVQATAVRASFDCAQSTRAYAVELEAWERQTPPDNCAAFASIPQDNQGPLFGEDNSTASIIADSDRFWWRYFGNWDIEGTIRSHLSHNSPGPAGISAWWEYGIRAEALIKMYDLLAPVDFARALVYLERLRRMSNAFLDNRDDKRLSASFPNVSQYPDPPPPYDTFHRQIMPGWGSLLPENGNHWTAQVDMSGLFTYPMAAFARRVADHPDWFCLGYRQDAIKFTNAVLETYTAFRTDMLLSAGWSFYRGLDGQGSPYNVTLSSLRSLVEVASAANSQLYTSSSQFNPDNFCYATNEAPYFIAGNVKWFVDNIQSGDPSKTVDHIPWYWWRYALYRPASPNPENLSHAQLTLGSLLLVWENRTIIDGLLAHNGYSQRVASLLTSTFFTTIANTFLERIWYYDYTPGSQLHDLLTDRIDGPNSDVYRINEPLPTLSQHGNAYCAEFVPLAQFNPWVWARCRDAAFNSALVPDPACIPPNGDTAGALDCTHPALVVTNHAALLRYRAWW